MVVHHDEAERVVCKVAVGRKDGVRAEAEGLPKVATAMNQSVWLYGL